MRKRRLVVCSRDSRSCEMHGRHIHLEFILLVPKGQYFDGVVNFPSEVDLGKYSKIIFEPKNTEKPLPYKRRPISLYNSKGMTTWCYDNDREDEEVNKKNRLKDIFLRIPILSDPVKIPDKGPVCNCVTSCEEMILGDAGYFYSGSITMCHECLDSYDYYTVFECEYESRFQPKFSYVADMLAPEFKRLLQFDYPRSNYVDNLKRYAADGDVMAMSYLALTYFNGEGVERNLEEAAKWWRLAAEKSIERN